MRRVYFIKPVGMDGPIKIGCSASPDGRRNSLETWSPFALEIVAELDGDLHLERRFHLRFEESCQRREWFNWTPELAEAIRQINAGTFDVSTLPTSGKRSARRSRDLSYITPGFRLRLSVQARINHIKGASMYDPRVGAILGVERHYQATNEDFIDNREALEALISDMRAASPKRANREQSRRPTDTRVSTTVTA